MRKPNPSLTGYGIGYVCTKASTVNDEVQSNALVFELYVIANVANEADASSVIIPVLASRYKPILVGFPPLTYRYFIVPVSAGIEKLVSHEATFFILLSKVILYGTKADDRQNAALIR